MASITDDLGFIATKLNKLLSENFPLETFITAFLALMDFRKEELRFVNCGHVPPLIADSEGNIAELGEARYKPLGIFPDQEYTETKLKLQRGMTLLVYSDGVTEARNKEGETFGFERLRSIFSRLWYDDPKRLVARIYREIKLFTKQRKPSDDLSILVVKLI